MGVKLSACVITKNEEKNIPSWLKCMKAVADEMIVVDTGSVDNTVELAREAGAKIYHFKWINDFAAAKNYAIEQATGDWIMFLDADETFTDYAQSVLRQEMTRFNQDDTVACLLNRVIDIDVDNNNRIFNNSLLPRIFRRSPYIRYAGAIHEQVENRKGNKRAIMAEKLEILHTGYSSSICQSKAERNLPILLQELEKATTKEEYKKLYPYIMDSYNTLEDYEKVIFYGQQCIDNDCVMVGAPAHFYEAITMSMFNSRKPFAIVLAKLDEAMEKYPDNPFFLFVRAMVLEKMEDYIGSARAVKEGIELRKILINKMSQGAGISDTSIGFVPYAYERLGNIYTLKGDLKLAAENYLLALQAHKYQDDSLKGLCRALASLEDADIIELLNTLYDKQQDGAFIVKTLKGYVSSGVMAYYSKGVQSCVSSFAYMAAGRFDGAVVKLGDRYKELIQLGVLSANNMEEPSHDGYLNALTSDGYLKRFEKDTKEKCAVKRLKEYRKQVGLDV